MAPTRREIDEQDVLDKRILSEKLTHLQEDVKEIKQVVMSQYVTKDMFEPVRLLVYGMVGAMLLGVLGALGALILGRH